ncbi:hypothetical protein [Thermomonas sp.]|uniref:hypothetical protein n=1 Tax=Thermomonas sp. TaxID=1971895 RepID=UPI002634E8CF|nr:hypothetical protein [Thermomonas sp.]
MSIAKDNLAMILRHLARSLKEQNWTAILVEFVLLVLGVFLGIQASNWNAQREEDAKARAFLERIRINLETDAHSIQRREVFWTRVIAYGKQAIHYAETGEKVDGSAWKTVLAFYQASQLWQWATSDSTYQELRSGGELGLIRDQVLRDALSRYYVENGPGTEYLFMLQPEYRRIVRGLTPQTVADHIWAKCWRQPNPGEQYLYDCDAPIPEAQAQAILDRYMNDPDLLPELRFWVANQSVSLVVISNYTPLVKDMLARTRLNSVP